MIRTTPIRFRVIPARIISPIFTSPVPKTIAFGGVATGSMNAHEADSVAGIIKRSGSIPIAVPSDPSTGRTISVVAVFDVSSVKNVSIEQTDITIATGGKSPSAVNWPPSQSERPDILNPLASAKPPPKRFETVVTVTPERRSFAAPAGMLYVPAAQRAGTLAVYLLEPHSDDGFTRWQFLDGELKVGSHHPVHRVIRVPAPPKKAE